MGPTFHKAPSWRCLFLIAVVVMAGGWLIAVHPMSGGADQGRHCENMSVPSSAPLPGQKRVLTKLSRWVSYKYPRVRKRLKRKVTRLKRVLVSE